MSITHGTPPPQKKIVLRMPEDKAKSGSYLRLIRDPARDAVTNMEIDRYLLESHIHRGEAGATLRFYRFSEPALTVGYGAWPLAHRNLPPKSIAVRRITGGGVVSHGEDLNYTLVAPILRNRILSRVRESYVEIHEMARSALCTFGIETEFADGRGSGANSVFCFEQPVFGDLVIGARKVAGAGQKRSRGYLLHQGSIAWNELKAQNAALKEDAFELAFARECSDRLCLPLQEIPFSAEEENEISISREVSSGLSRSSS